ncbi:PIG-L family deacetylase [Dactylosporangium vinaceum]|uniref:PIG-L deacetylase family protein n=1 Tax=Dactylosporangium vinaceum TaxID=53362 RepID=A0ABV5MSA1_9ACTN|nr:PIG-L deacetylase family protein [Dactylosporangium vinaceum]UAC00209.1 PIG-L family deacetylase [Dactylosporangium vinaceum]
MDEPLRPLSEHWSRALALVAHPDDLEFGAASAIARWTAAGRTVVYALVTSGEAGIDGIAPATAGPLREAEQRAAAAEVGVTEVEFLGLPDGVLEYGLPLRRAIAHCVRRHRPEIVITNNFRDTWETGELNQADHIATGRALVDAVRDAGNRWVFPEEGLEPWPGVRQIWAAHSPLATHGVDVTETLEAGTRSLLAHEAYNAGLNLPGFDPAEFLRDLAAGTGPRLGCRYAVAFEVVRFG